MAYFLRETFIEGKKQTGISLAINQFNIFQKELDGYIEEAKQINFKTNIEGISRIYKSHFDESNGIYYIGLFKILDQIKYYTPESGEKQTVVDDFRHQILFPLFRFYDKLFHFIQRIDRDEILSKEYKNILYNYIERDLLQTYFRISNNSLDGSSLLYDLTPFETPVFDTKLLYRINQFYATKNAFQYKDLNFYVTTL